MLTEDINVFNAKINQGVLISLDMGTKFIGVALSDFEQKLSLPHDILRRTKLDEDLQQIVDLIQEKKAVAAIIGLPLDNNQQERHLSVRVRNFAKFLTLVMKEFTKNDFPIFLYYEGFTSSLANVMMKEGKIKFTEMFENNDKVAAHIMLMEFINYKNNKVNS